MKKENDIQAELTGWGSPLADMSRAMPFMVPGSYFELNAKEIVAHAITDGTTLGNKRSPFAVPGGYFDALPLQLLDAAKAEELNETLPKHMPYTLPEKYFDALPAQVLVRTKDKPAGKTIRLAPHIWLRQTIAAVLLVGIGIGGFEYVSNRHANPEKQLANVPQTSVQEYVHQNLNDVDVDQQQGTVSDVTVVKATDQLDKNDIEQYLDETGLKTEYNLK